ncbi:DUF4974 domain-containing protein [Fulvivirga sp. M361]|uniref:FecR family protein n=1 Tax=Fulvivirga sp. M361 TaxID=2594266 RepID=UPI00117A20D4|nr:FecR family protein [Fulvivirga sp. M361]TRX59229.1 DUF4974 domain-containing protein [Fulvivirga sp. M361]
MSRKVTKNQLELLADKVLKGTATEQEQEQLNTWYQSFDDHKVLLFTDESPRELQLRLLNRINADLRTDLKPDRRQNKSFLKLAVAISLIFVSIACLYLTFDKDPEKFGSEAFIFSESKNTQWGQKKVVKLPDGTVVKLNSGTSIKYPQNFQVDKRQVELSGEAFFDVAHDETRPFVINAGDIAVKVLGTSFNVRSYSEESEIDVMVMTGKVRVIKSETDESVTLLPDQMATYFPLSKTLERKSIPDKDAVFGWIDGNLVFRDQDFQTVIRTLSRWYGVQFRVSDDLFLTKKITANFSNASLKEVMKILSHNYEFRFKIKEKIVEIN